MKSYTDIQGWTDFENIYENAVQNVKAGGTLVEVGSWLGKSSAMMCEKIRASEKPLKFFCVDIWDNYEELQGKIDAMGGNVFAHFQENMQQHAGYYTALRMKSVDAAKSFAYNSCDFVFIDACHDYEYVVQDIELWLPRVKVGGIIAGHDFWKEGVCRAVREKLPESLDERNKLDNESFIKWTSLNKNNLTPCMLCLKSLLTALCGVIMV